MIVLESNRDNMNTNLDAALKYIALAQRFERDMAKRESLRKIVNRLSEMYGLKDYKSSYQDVTLLVDCVHESISFDQIIQYLLKHSKNSYSTNLDIIIGVSQSNYLKHKVDMISFQKHLPNVRIVLPGKHEQSTIKTLRYLISYVRTTNVVFARSFNVFDGLHLNIGKLINPLEMGNADVVGGTMYSNEKGWSLGCYQVSLIWYQMKIQKGFDVKKPHNYVKCDFIEGPFVTPLRLLVDYFNSWKVTDFTSDENIMADHYLSKSTPMELSIDLLYFDFFHYMKENAKKTDVCVDCLFRNIRDNDLGVERYMKILRSHWQSFGDKNKISEILIQPGIVDEHSKHHIFSCKEINLVCHRRRKDMFAEKCCIRNLHNLLMDTYQIFDKYELEYSSADGTALGSIKVMTTLPWDLDHDFEFRTGNFLKVVEQKEEFAQKDISLKTEFDDPCMQKPTKRFTCGYTAFKSKGWRIEAWGQYLFMSDYHESHKLPLRNRDLFPVSRINGTPTLTRIGDHWSRSRPNPGLFARGSYGLDVLRHAKHWILSSKENSHASYETSRTFGPCSRDGFHGCMNRYISDGNIQFHRPWA